MLRTAFPDFHQEIEEVVAEDDKVVVRPTMRGTHMSPFMGIPPTGRRLEQQQIHISGAPARLRVADSAVMALDARIPAIK